MMHHWTGLSWAYCCYCAFVYTVNTRVSEQNGNEFADNIIPCIVVKWWFGFSVKFPVTICYHRGDKYLGIEQVPSHYLRQWWPISPADICVCKIWQIYLLCMFYITLIKTKFNQCNVFSAISSFAIYLSWTDIYLATNYNLISSSYAIICCIDQWDNKHRFGCSSSAGYLSLKWSSRH